MIKPPKPLQSFLICYFDSKCDNFDLRLKEKMSSQPPPRHYDHGKMAPQPAPLEELFALATLPMLIRYVLIKSLLGALAKKKVKHNTTYFRSTKLTFSHGSFM